MKKRTLLQILLSCLFVAGSTVFWACQKETQTPKISQGGQNEYSEVIQNYFDTKNKLLIDGLSVEDKSGYINLSSNEKNARKVINDNSMINQVYEESNIKIINMKTHFSIDSVVSLGDNRFEFIVSTITETFTNAKDAVTGEPMVSKEASVYKIIIKKQQNKWLVDEESLLKDTYKNSLILKANVEIQPKNNAKVLATYYNRSVAAKFAYDNALKDIACSGWFSGRYNWWGNGDCSNFVSTSLQAGGWTQNDVWNFKSYYCQASDAWAGADAFKRYTQSSNRIYSYSSTINSLKLGDVVSCDWTGNGTFDHTIIVTGIDNLGQRYFSYHTKNNQNVAFPIFMARAYQQQGMYPTLMAFRLKDSY